MDPADEFVQRRFPGIERTGYRVTSPASHYYNCIAWAMNDPEHWWDPGHGMTNYYWPPGVPRNWALLSCIKAFEAAGFERCAGPAREAGYDKVALFVDSEGNCTHAARQLESGAWTSKLGIREDIEHTELTAVESDEY